MIESVRVQRIIHEKYHDELTNDDPTLKIDYQTLQKYYLELAEQLITEYKYNIQIITKIVNKMTIQGTKKRVQLQNVTPITPIRQIHQSSKGKLISTEGIIRKTSSVYNKIKRAAWQCNNCGSNTMYKMKHGDKLNEPKDKCRYCNHKQGYTLNQQASTFVDVQKYTIQENIEQVKTGYKPAQLTGFLTNSQIDKIKPGDKVRVNGLIELRNKAKENKFQEFLLTENLEYLAKDYSEILINPTDVKNFREKAKNTDMIKLFKQKVAPTLYGYDEVKEAITLQLFGADTTNNTDGTKNRGDIHILLIGDPGIGKSQILKSVTGIVPRGIYTSGKSSSGAGLTASAVKDEKDSWSLEAGAMVLADKGLVAIDEFDKMREEDRSSIHEALEQQTISMAKAGNIATLHSRCSVLAAANPKFGQFNPMKTIQEQINLQSTLLSRFDLIFILTDNKEVRHDEMVARSILNSTIADETDDFDYMKYISYAKREIHPVLEEGEAKERLVKFYQDWRQTSEINADALPVTARQLMAVSRLAAASARARLSDKINLDDVERAIRLQEYCIRNTGYTIDVSTEVMKVEDKLDKFKQELQGIADEYQNCIPTHILMKTGSTFNISNDELREYLKQLDDANYLVCDVDNNTWSM